MSDFYIKDWHEKKLAHFNEKEQIKILRFEHILKHPDQAKTVEEINFLRVFLGSFLPSTKIELYFEEKKNIFEKYMPNNMIDSQLGITGKLHGDPVIILKNGELIVDKFSFKMRFDNSVEQQAKNIIDSFNKINIAEATMFKRGDIKSELNKHSIFLSTYKLSMEHYTVLKDFSSPNILKNIKADIEVYKSKLTFTKIRLLSGRKNYLHEIEIKKYKELFLIKNAHESITTYYSKHKTENIDIYFSIFTYIPSYKIHKKDSYSNTDIELSNSLLNLKKNLDLFQIQKWAKNLASIIQHYTVVCCVPSSKPKREAGVIGKIVEQLCKYNESINYEKNLLSRNKEIEKRSNMGSDRSIDIHLNTIDITNQSIKHDKILLIDDITTTGNSLLACKRKLKEIGIKEVGMLTLARTVDDYETK